MAEDELQIEDSGSKNKMMIIIAIAAVVILAGGVGGYFLLSGDDESPAAAQLEPNENASADQLPADDPNAGTALYVAMPRPFVLNVPGNSRDRLVEIKVQLMVRGTDNEEIAKTHIPLIEGTLLQVFSASSADELVTEAGKIAVREKAATEVRRVMNEIAGTDVVEQVLFTGFVMQ